MMFEAATQRPGLDALRDQLSGALAEALPDLDEPRLSYLCKPKAVADDATKLLVRDDLGYPVAVVLISSAVEPGLVRRGIERAQAIREHLGAELGGVILTPYATGMVGGKTYTVLPYCKPMGSGRITKRAHRIMLRPLVLEWLASVTERTARAADYWEVERGFLGPLEELAGAAFMDPAVRSGAEEAIGRLRSGAWEPRFTVMHGDLWCGNILFSNKRHRRRTDRFARIVVIDWPGGLIDGYGMYDLVRLSRSMHISGPVMRAQVGRQCRALGCEPADARNHLLAGLAHLGQHLGHFPPERFAKMAAGCLRTIDETVGR